MNIFTHRERHVVFIVILTIIAFLFAMNTSLIDQQTIDDWALIWLVFYVLPLGIYIVTDKERRSNLEE